MKIFTLNSLLIATMGLVAGAHADTAPLPPQQMWEYSDAIVVVDVLSLTCTGEFGLQGEPVYRVKMLVQEVKKGTLPVGHLIVWSMSDYQPPAGDYGGGIFYPGERHLLYLERYPSGTYNTWGSNCVETIHEVPEDERHLPDRAGETIRTNFTPPGGYTSGCVTRLPAKNRWERFPACHPQNDRQTASTGKMPIQRFKKQKSPHVHQTYFSRHGRRADRLRLGRAACP